MKLYFIRHGQTDWNEAGKIQGSCDIELNAKGLQQAENLSKTLQKEANTITKIYTSHQKRAQQTATIVGQAFGTEPIIIDGLQEVNLGHWEGLSWSEVKGQYPLEYEEWHHNRRYAKPHRGESYQEVVERAMNAIHTIVSDNSCDVAVVTHNAVIMCLQCYLTDSPFEDMKRFKSDNAAITVIDSDLLHNK